MENYTITYLEKRNSKYKLKKVAARTKSEAAYLFYISNPGRKIITSIKSQKEMKETF